MFKVTLFSDCLTCGRERVKGVDASAAGKYSNQSQHNTHTHTHMQEREGEWAGQVSFQSFTAARKFLVFLIRLLVEV